jgi:hypothetical protein
VGGSSCGIVVGGERPVRIDAREARLMGILDKIKGMLSKNKGGAKKGVDTAADQAKKVVPDAHDGKVDKAADAAKDAIEKLPD